MDIYENKAAMSEIAAILQAYIKGGGIKHYVEPFAVDFNTVVKIECEHRLVNNDNAKICEYLETRRGKLRDELPTVRGVLVGCCDYYKLRLPRRERALIFCAPPPQLIYNGKRSFAFWRWCRKQAQLGHVVVVQAWRAPVDYVEIWAKHVKKCEIKGSTISQIKRLFIFGG